jgi:hypothetical protein
MSVGFGVREPPKKPPSGKESAKKGEKTPLSGKRFSKKR